MTNLLLIACSLIEVVLLFVVAAFFSRLKKSEVLLTRLQSQHEAFVNKLTFSAQMEQEMIQTFAKRQEELSRLDATLEERAAELKGLVEHAEAFCRSPRFLRQVILAGSEQGKKPEELAKTTGLSVEEVKLILDQAGDQAGGDSPGG